MRVDQAPEAGKTRLNAAAALDAVAGAWGDGDMLCVALDAANDLILATNTDVFGVILTTEGRELDSTGANLHKNVIGGRKYTVFSRAEFVDADEATSPALANGDKVFCTALGDVVTTGVAGDVFVGFVSNGRLILDIGRLPVA